MSVRLRRLYAEYERLKDLFADHERIRIVEAIGDPPDRYVVEYRVKGLIDNKGAIEESNVHRVQITLGPNYPNEMASYVAITPIFHPNIDHLAVCTADKDAAGTKIEDNIVFIGRMITFQVYNLQSPRNGDAAKWTLANLDRLPLETVNLFPRKILEGAAIRAVLPDQVREKPAAPAPAAQTACSNCGRNDAGAGLRECSGHHVTCCDCTLNCANCRQVLCVLCAVHACSDCRDQVCADCVANCAQCHRPVCPSHAVVCSVCRAIRCQTCSAVCAGCGGLLCKDHLDAAGRCPACSKGAGGSTFARADTEQVLGTPAPPERQAAFESSSVPQAAMDRKPNVPHAQPVQPAMPSVLTPAAPDTPRTPPSAPFPPSISASAVGGATVPPARPASWPLPNPAAVAPKPDPSQMPPPPVFPPLAVGAGVGSAAGAAFPAVPTPRESSIPSLPSQQTPANSRPAPARIPTPPLAPPVTNSASPGFATLPPQSAIAASVPPTLVLPSRAAVPTVPPAPRALVSTPPQLAALRTVPATPPPVALLAKPDPVPEPPPHRPLLHTTPGSAVGMPNDGDRFHRPTRVVITADEALRVPQSKLLVPDGRLQISPATEPSFSGKAIASLAFGILSLPVVGILVGWFAVLFGAMAIRQIDRTERLRGKALAMTGIILGVAGILFWLILLVAYGPSLFTSRFGNVPGTPVR